MREHKFRAWNPEEKTMLKPFDLSSNPKYWCDNLKDYPLMQFTGLKDKNGVEIYEGDVVRYYGGSNSWVVTFGEYKRQNYMNGDNQVSHLGFYGRPIPNYDKESNNDWNGKIVTLLADDFCNGKEVIGNIYENPELLDNN